MVEVTKPNHRPPASEGPVPCYLLVLPSPTAFPWPASNSPGTLPPAPPCSRKDSLRPGNALCSSTSLTSVWSGEETSRHAVGAYSAQPQSAPVGPFPPPTEPTTLSHRRD